MSTLLVDEPATAKEAVAPVEGPLLLRTRAEAREYLAKHLKPVGYGPKGQPLYAKKDIDALNIVLPEDI